MWQSHVVEVSAVTIHYYRTGGRNPPLILAHGMTDNAQCWSRVARALAQDYDVIAYDARGHGESSAPEEGYDVTDHAADLLGLINILQLAHPILVGHSMGAATSAYLASIHPTIPAGLILEDPPLTVPTSHAASKEQRDIAQQIQRRVALMMRRAQKRSGEFARTIARPPGWDDEDAQAWIDAKGQLSPNVGNVGERPAIPWLEILPRIQCPTLLITGDEAFGAIMPVDIAQEMTVVVPNLRSVHIAGAGHHIRCTQFDQYIAVIQSFLQCLEVNTQKAA